MNVEYLWKIVSLDRDAVSGFVVNVHWDCVGLEESGVSGRVYGVESFSPKESSSFIPFEDLTQETVLNWVWFKISKEEYEQKVYNIILNQIQPKIVSELPW